MIPPENMEPADRAALVDAIRRCQYDGLDENVQVIHHESEMRTRIVISFIDPRTDYFHSKFSPTQALMVLTAPSQWTDVDRMESAPHYPGENIEPSKHLHRVRNAAEQLNKLDLLEISPERATLHGSFHIRVPPPPPPDQAESKAEVLTRAFMQLCEHYMPDADPAQVIADFTQAFIAIHTQRRGEQLDPTLVVARSECRYCGKLFERNHPNHKYCSQECIKDAERDKKLKEKAALQAMRELNLLDEGDDDAD